MTRREYLATLLHHYVRVPDTPDGPRRRDRAVAADLYHRSVPLDHVLHAIRLASLRRHLTGPYPPIQSLAYYRTVLLRLSAEELEPDYVAYIQQQHRDHGLTGADAKPRLRSQDPALSDRR